MSECLEPLLLGAVRHGAGLVAYQHAPARAHQWRVAQQVHLLLDRLAGQPAGRDLGESTQLSFIDRNAQLIGHRDRAAGLADPRRAMEQKRCWVELGYEEPYRS